MWRNLKHPGRGLSLAKLTLLNQEEIPLDTKKAAAMYSDLLYTTDPFGLKTDT